MITLRPVFKGIIEEFVSGRPGEVLVDMLHMKDGVLSYKGKVLAESCPYGVAFTHDYTTEESRLIAGYPGEDVNAAFKHRHMPEWWEMVRVVRDMSRAEYGRSHTISTPFVGSGLVAYNTIIWFATGTHKAARIAIRDDDCSISPGALIHLAKGLTQNVEAIHRVYGTTALELDESIRMYLNIISKWDILLDTPAKIMLFSNAWYSPESVPLPSEPAFVTFLVDYLRRSSKELLQA